MKRKRLTIIILIIALLLTACSGGGKDYSYNNLMTEQSVNEFKSALVSHTVPDEDINKLLDYIGAYNKADYAKNNLKADWQRAKITDNLYNYTEAIDAYVDTSFEDINCREAAYIIFNSFVNVDAETLFATLDSEESVTEAVKKHWDSHDVSFNGDDIHLVSLWGNNGSVGNMHAGILIENEEELLLFEKTDPIMPYQLSRFDSREDIKEYLLNRSDEYGDQVVFIDDEAI